MLKIIFRHIVKTTSYYLYTIFLLVILSNNINAQTKSTTSITYNNEPLRELSEKYFGNPDYWESILVFNNFKSVDELRTGMKLEIPTGIVTTTLKQMLEAQTKISTANKNGAKVLTTDLITKAELNFNKALQLKQQGDWSQAYDTLQDVLKLATESLKQVLELRKSAADASISYTKGDVQKRKPSQKIWSEAELYTKLYEADRARTMSNSIAEITFIDLSRIRLNENSQALIQHSRIDLLKNKTETTVRLIKGDAFAYLLKSPKKKFDIDVPGLDAKIKSKSFWIQKETLSTKIANFDGEIQLTAQDSVVVVKENQGSMIPDGGVPSEPTNLLPPPRLISPQNRTKFYENNISFNWGSIPTSKYYWFEIASDATFKNIIYSNKKLTSTQVKVEKLTTGVYYWHLCSIDDQGFPGEFSQYNYLILVKDVTMPFLVLTSPNNNEVTKLKNIVVAGEAEMGLTLSVNNNIVEINKNGKFQTNVQLENGSNEIIISSLDDSGNKTNISRTVFLEDSDKILNIIKSKIYLDEQKLFVINSSELSIKGITRPLSEIKFVNGGNEERTYADAKGNYSLNINISNEHEELSQKIITPAGYTTSAKYKVRLDDVAPILKINEIPKQTNKGSLKISGSVLESDSLFINSALVAVTNNNFEYETNLIEGVNNFKIVANDIANNVVHKNISIFKDSLPPELLDYSFKRDSKNKNEYLIRVNYRDESDVRKTAIVTIAIDGVDKEEILLLNKNKNEYSKRIYTNNASSTVIVKNVLLEDYLGNKTKYDTK